MNVSGMIYPRSGQEFSLEFMHRDRELFQALLDEAYRLIILERPRNILIVDNAS